ncbi:MAG: nuclear transport factor 2 family protein [Chloroflexota bacterium]|nr:nuclear transport factor 2 family protein [Dehalococcoidia bacterium]MDW8046626.1 nuclear transport factor 2 family protein [Chloroflexota bacterium]
MTLTRSRVEWRGVTAKGHRLRMSNIEVVQELVEAINYDRFAAIEALHNPDVTFYSFRGPILHDSVSVMDWHREFAQRYADLTYTELEFIEEGDIVALRATLEAKGYDWRPFTQRVAEVFRIVDGGIQERRMYAMLRDLELDKPATQAMAAALEYRGGSPAATKAVVSAFYQALLAGNRDEARAHLAEKCAYIDSVYGLAAGPEAALELFAETPKPAFGVWRVTRIVPGPKSALVELAIDPNRPRAAHWVRLVEEKITVIEAYWMLREIGINPYVEYSRDRHLRKVIFPA